MGEVQGGEGFNAALEAVVDDVTIVPEESEATPKPTPEPVAATEPVVPTPDDGVDRTAKFQAAMTELEKHLPDEAKQVFKGRVEQAVRWGRPGEAEVKTLTERFGEFNKLAEELAPNFTQGAEYLQKHGAAAFLREAMKYQPAEAGVVPEPEPTDVSPALVAVQKQLKELQADRAQERKTREDRAAEEQLRADLTPFVKETLKGYGIQDEGGKVEGVLAQLAQLQYFWNAYGMPAGTSTPARAVRDVTDMLEVVTSARAKKAPTRTKPNKVEVVRNLESRQSRSYKDMEEDFFVGLGKQTKAAAEEIAKG